MLLTDVMKEQNVEMNDLQHVKVSQEGKHCRSRNITLRSVEEQTRIEAASISLIDENGNIFVND